jgi:hypothetical protein
MFGKTLLNRGSAPCKASAYKEHKNRKSGTYTKVCPKVSGVTVWREN